MRNPTYGVPFRAVCLALILSGKVWPQAADFRTADSVWEDMFGTARYPTCDMLFVAYKYPARFDVYATHLDGEIYRIASYPIRQICTALGPKRSAVDPVTPEGVYRIVSAGADSAGALFLAIDYPNASDSMRGTAGNLGGGICVQGSISLAGSIGMGDSIMNILFRLVGKCMERGQTTIPLYLFQDDDYFNALYFADFLRSGNGYVEGCNAPSAKISSDSVLAEFSETLGEIQAALIEGKRIPDVELDSRGLFVVKDREHCPWIQVLIHWNDPSPETESGSGYEFNPNAIGCLRDNRTVPDHDPFIFGTLAVRRVCSRDPMTVRTRTAADNAFGGNEQ